MRRFIRNEYRLLRYHYLDLSGCHLGRTARQRPFVWLYVFGALFLALMVFAVLPLEWNWPWFGAALCLVITGSIALWLLAVTQPALDGTDGRI